MEWNLVSQLERYEEEKQLRYGRIKSQPPDKAGLCSSSPQVARLRRRERRPDEAQLMQD